MRHLISFANLIALILKYSHLGEQVKTKDFHLSCAQLGRDLDFHLLFLAAQGQAILSKQSLLAKLIGKSNIGTY